jgi:hypothetical protein
MISIKHIPGTSHEVYEIIGRYAMDHKVILKRRNIPIITKDNYTWHILMDGRKVKAFVGEEQILSYTKLQAFVVLDATKSDLRWFVKEILRRFRETNYPKITISVLHEYSDIFAKEKFEIVNLKKNWTDLAFIQYEEAQQAP